MEQPSLVFDYPRRFGVEIEINSFDGLDKPADRNTLPSGIHYVGNLVTKTTKKYTEIRKYGHTHWNNTAGFWVVKPDASCGLEICSPVCKGWLGLRDICEVIDAIAADKHIQIDERCSLHVHIDVTDCTISELDRILRCWIKAEPVFIDSVPDSRKVNKHCQFIGLWDWVSTESDISPEKLIGILGKSKYLTVNTFHLLNGERATIEFRLGEHWACKNSFAVKNWVRLLIHFVEMAKKKKLKKAYEPNDVWSSFLWLEPDDLFELLEFNDSYILSDGMEQIRNWFISRLICNVSSELDGILGKSARKVSSLQILKRAQRLIQSNIDLEKALSPSDIQDAVYSEVFKN